MDKSMTPDQLSDVNKLRLGDPVLCVVRDVYKDRLMVTLDLKKPEELMERLDDLRFNNTPRSQSTNTVSAYNSTSSKTAKDRYHRGKKISHPFWKNVTLQETMQLFNEGNIDPVIRPSSLNADGVTVTFILFHVPDPRPEDPNHKKPVCYHFDLTECRTNAEDAPYWLAGESGQFVFNDLDQVIAMYVNRFQELGEEITTHKNFEWSDEDEIYEKLEALFNLEGNKIHYRIVPEYSAGAEKPACFRIYFIDKASDPVKPFKIRCLPVSLSFEGFSLRTVKQGDDHKGPHKNVGKLLDAFKKFYLLFKTRRRR
jgi:hypothetical protein